MNAETSIMDPPAVDPLDLGPQTIVVHGAAGLQGGPVMRRLLADGFTVRAITRHPDARRLPAAVTPVRADIGDVESLVAAYRGADGVYLQLPLEFDPVLAPRQAAAALEALSRADVPQVVFNTSLGLTDRPVGQPFADARALVVAGLGDAVGWATVTGPAAFYADNFLLDFSRRAIAAGRVEYPLPAAARVAWTAAADIGAVASRAFASDTPPMIRIVRGPQALTGHQVAAVLSEATGRPVAWETVEPDYYGDLLVPAVGPGAAAGIAASYAAPAEDPPELPEEDVVTGETDLATWARAQDWDAA
ncbi:MAG: NmrA family NAD(P)-binding protein [Bifidobacteriaceae bacterium]|jgi:uncharacterized protein YbjT (DUF2867 family)|nr:NmrA family NAD(P)-binding protein [Bifidobacteriaceae bacterium]